ncbi:MAG: cardiolipin synthase [Oligoflexus sp.]
MSEFFQPSIFTSSVNAAWIVVVYLLALLNVVKILRDEMNPTAATAWILVNLSFPLIGVPLYYFLGQNKLKGYSKRRRATQSIYSSQREAQKLEHLIKNNAKDDEKDDVPQNMILVKPSFNEIAILDDGTRAFREIFQAISQAKTFILVQYYIFRPDRLGRHFKDLLMERAKHGVQIFFIFDNLGSFGMTARYLRDLKKAGVHVARFLPFHVRFNLQINYRNHRKLVVVDGHTAFVGGMNVGTEYLGKTRFWRDTQLKIQGPAIIQLMDTFLDDWNFAVRGKRRYLPLKYFRHATQLERGKIPTRVISFGPGDQLAIGLYLFMHLIQLANKRIIIATPYFIPDVVLERCLELALQRGVEVTLIIPQKPDHWFIKPISHVSIRRFAKAGGRVFLYENGFMHQKVMLIDDLHALIGTSNFDNRSIYLNFETCLVMSEQGFAGQVAQMLQKDLQESRPLDPKEHESTSYLILANLARLLAPLF